MPQAMTQKSIYFTIGIALISYGVYLWSMPLALIVAGTLIILGVICAVLAEMGKRSSELEHQATQKAIETFGTDTTKRALRNQKHAQH
jgi:predicted ferric reductase